uniref:USP domain-containing protein n=1 Tax=viral metagenome TaxID=1070528 RepID=A0A6C0KG94_9ZZZZ
MSFDKYKDQGLTGLANLGNTCFINSTIQCLSHTYEFSEFLERKNYEKKIKNIPDSLALFEWKKLLDIMWSENCIISPGGFISTIQKLAQIKNQTLFTGFAQNDLPEFLYFLVDCFHNGLKRDVNMNINGTIKNEKDKLAQKCYEMMKVMYKKEYSEILDIFYGIHISQIKNTNEEILAETPEPFFILSLPIPSNNNPSLIDCFNLYTENELLVGDNQYQLADNDNTSKIDANKNIVFWSFPSVLVIDLKRFSHNLRKNQAVVTFPFNDLDLTSYVIGYNKISYVYDLYAICNHSGNVLGGHYTAFVKNANDKWYEFNDTKVREIKNLNELVTNKAYCFFYRKKKIQ